MFKSKTTLMIVLATLAVVIGSVLIYLNRPYLVARPEKVLATCFWDSTKFPNRRCDTCDDPFAKHNVPQAPFTIDGVLYAACCPIGYEPRLEDNVIVCNKQR
jgi:hypothetical protein